MNLLLAIALATPEASARTLFSLKYGSANACSFAMRNPVQPFPPELRSYLLCVLAGSLALAGAGIVAAVVTSSPSSTKEAAFILSFFVIVASVVAGYGIVCGCVLWLRFCVLVEYPVLCYRTAVIVCNL